MNVTGTVFLDHYCRYQSAKDPSYVDYMQFSDEVESIFTRKDLEKTPTADVQQFIPPVEVNMNVLSPEEEQILQKTMHRLAERVRGIGRGGDGRRDGRERWGWYYNLCNHWYYNLH